MAAGNLLATPSISEVHSITPYQTEGPFYPQHDQLDKDADLTRIQGRSEKAAGEVIFVSGRVLDMFGNPIEGVLIDIWQANKYGRYDHANDPNPAPLDPNFQGWAQLMTGSDGVYNIMTIKPGAYPQGDAWRPPHIHYGLSKRGYKEITTQMYFKDDPLNDLDGLLLAVKPKALRETLIVDFKTGIGKFDVVLATRNR